MISIMILKHAISLLFISAFSLIASDEFPGNSLYCTFGSSSTFYLVKQHHHCLSDCWDWPNNWSNNAVSPSHDVGPGVAAKLHKSSP